MLEIGGYNTLTVLRKVDFGYYLDGLDYGDILMPAKYAAAELQACDKVDVFIYLDSSEKLIATTEIPLAQTGEFGFLKVMKVNEFGAFLDWGITKQLFVPFAEQKVKMEEGKSYLTYIFIDPVTERITGSSKIFRFVDQVPPLIKENTLYEGIVWQKTDLGYKIIINHNNSGLLFHNEVFKALHQGDKINVYVKNIRPDGKIDLTLTSNALEKSDEVSQIILQKLRDNKGFLPLGDHSEPEMVMSTLNMSKKNFKKGIGKLYKDRLISIEENGIYLVTED